MYNKQSSVCLIRVQSEYLMSTNMILFCVCIEFENVRSDCCIDPVPKLLRL